MRRKVFVKSAFPVTSRLLRRVALAVLAVSAACDSAPATSPSDAAITATIDAYLASITAGDKEAYLRLFSDDATVEDPIGSEVHRGKDELASFFDHFQRLAESNTLSLIDSPRIVENEAIFMFQSILVTDGHYERICPIDHAVFDDEAKITSLRAFWTQADFHPYDPDRPGEPCRI